MSKEFGLKFILEEGTEAYRCIPELKAFGTPVIFGPISKRSGGYRLSGGQYGGYTGESYRLCLTAASKLIDAKIPMALTAGGLTGEDALCHQATQAIRYGLSFEETMKAVTVTPAKILGISKIAGSIKVGLDADLVLWTEKPFSLTSKPALVMIKGEIVYRD